jgi:hypothetical protein
VFDITQTDGKELPAIGTVQGDPKDCTVRLQAFAKAQGISLEYSDQIAPARGVSYGGKVLLLPGQTPAEEFSTLTHELAHELLHRENAAAPPRSASARLKRKPPPLWSRARLASIRALRAATTSISGMETPPSSPRVFPSSDKPLRSYSRCSPTSERLCGWYKSRPFVHPMG